MIVIRRAIVVTLVKKNRNGNMSTCKNRFVVKNTVLNIVNDRCAHVNANTHTQPSARCLLLSVRVRGLHVSLETHLAAGPLAGSLHYRLRAQSLG